MSLVFHLDAISAEITAQRSERGAVVKIDGRLFAEYLVRSGTKPILWPIIGPTAKPMTRDFPMHDRPGEAKDHPHQRSLWFSHGSVNGIDFWAEQGKVGTIKHLEFAKIASGKPAVVATRNAWLAADGRRVCEDQRTLRFDTDGDARWIDFDITLKATDGDVVFGDTKEGTFGVRVAQKRSASMPAAEERSSTAADRRTPPPGAGPTPGSITTDRSTARPSASPSSITPTAFVILHIGTCEPTACLPPTRSACTTFPAARRPTALSPYAVATA